MKWYTRIRKKEYNKSLRIAKNQYYGNQLFNARKDPQKVWGIINNLLGRKSKSMNIPKITHNGVEYKDDKEIADVFSKYYKTSAVNRIKQINTNDNFETFLNEKDKRENTFGLKKIKESETWALIREIKPKCSSGYDQVPAKVLTKAAPVLATPMTMITNKCFEEGTFPKALKISKIIPGHKRNEYTPANFRPVALQSCFSKVIEKAAHNQLRDHNNEQFNDKFQFAYKQNNSCLHPVLLTRHYIEQELKNKKIVILMC